MKFDVLVVEDEASLLRGIVRGLSADKRLNTRGVQSVEEALEVLDSDPPDLLLTDIRLPGRSGLDLILELERRAIRIPIVVMTAHRTAYEGQISHRTGLTVLEKPVPLTQLREVVREKLDASQNVAGESGPFQLVDYLQLASLGHHSMAFELEVEGGKARLEVVDGDLWNAYFGETVGEQAVASLIEAEIRSLSYGVLESRPTDRQFRGGVEALLLDLARRQDEEERGSTGADQETAAELDVAFEGAYVPPTELDHGNESGRAAAFSTDDDAPEETLDEPSCLQCRRLVEGTRGAISCFLFDSLANCVVGAHGWSGGQRSDARIGFLLAAFESEPRAGDTDPLAGVTEVLATGRSDSRFLSRRVDGELIAVLTTDLTIKPGLGWMALRDLELDRDRSASGVSQTLPEPSELIWAEDQGGQKLSLVSQDLSLGTPEGKLAFFVDVATGDVKASSLSETRSLAILGSRHLRSVVGAFRGPGEGSTKPLYDEIQMSSPDAHLFLKRWQASSLVLGLLTGRATRPGVGWVAIREALDGFS